jgi:hypothetical protein
MMFDFSDLPFFDDHTHLLNVSNREITLKDYIGPFNHGYVDALPSSVPFNQDNCAGNNKPRDISDSMLEYVVKNLGVAKCFVNYLSQYFGCEMRLRRGFTGAQPPLDAGYGGLCESIV